MRALIVDDSKAIRKILNKTLGAIDIEVEEAIDGKDALDKLKVSHEHLDLVLVDWNMPEMNGLDFIKNVRGQEGFGNIPIMMVTTESEMEHMRLAMEAGANEYLMKPFTKEMIEEKLAILGLR
ncbi:MAG: response regulator [Myxococcota bacterium]|nr:response regulator [Myxococcota bacterium]